MESIEIRLLVESDIPAAMELKEQAGWNQTEDDWRRLLRLEPQGCFAAVRHGRLVGTTTTTTYANDLAWIGMVLVDRQNRRMGVATKLMTTALEYLEEKVSTVKLDATSQGGPVYERLGFQVESQIERWSGVAKSKPEGYRKGVNNEALSELFRLDQRAFSADRSRLIELLIKDAHVIPVLVKDVNGNLSGYALGRRGAKADYIGPVVVTDDGQIETLVDQVLDQLNGRVYIDLNNECTTGATVLSERGFEKERDLIRMCRGKTNTTSPFVVAIAGPEVG